MKLSYMVITKEFKTAAGTRFSDGPGGPGIGSRSERVKSVAAGDTEGHGSVFPSRGKQRWSDGRVTELERKVCQQTLKVEFS